MTSARTYGLQVGIAILLVVASTWAATQWAAAMFALGGAWLDMLGHKIYAP